MGYTELHRHLDICIRANTLLELLQEQKLEAQSTSIEAFVEKIQIIEPMQDLATVLAKFEAFQNAYYRPEVFERVGFEAAEDCHRAGITAVEFRFSPSFVCEKSGLAWTDALNGFCAGLARAETQYSELKTGLICIASRDYGPDAAAETVEFYLKHQDQFIGFDLAGVEEGFPPRLFKDVFAPLHQANANITIHAGESEGPAMIWEAIDLLGATRIGHGISAASDPELLKYLAQKRICLENCPTSNWVTQAVPSLENHPLPVFLKAGVPVTINTDDPGIFFSELPDELEICRKIIGLTEKDLKKCFEFAREHSFLPGLQLADL